MMNSQNREAGQNMNMHHAIDDMPSARAGPRPRQKVQTNERHISDKERGPQTAVQSLRHSAP